MRDDERLYRDNAALEAAAGGQWAAFAADVFGDLEAALREVFVAETLASASLDGGLYAVAVRAYLLGHAHARQDRGE